jgi:hypothetical protein
MDIVGMNETGYISFMNLLENIPELSKEREEIVGSIGLSDRLTCTPIEIPAKLYFNILNKMEKLENGN